MAALLTTTDLALPPHMADGLFKQATEGSTIALLSDQKPMLFGEHEFLDFNIGEAEFVDEGADKDSTPVTKKTKRAKPYKAQITVRFNQEVQWADEDTQLGVLQSVADKMGPKLARALDFGVIHGINPLTGLPVAKMTEFLSQTTNSTVVDPTDTAIALLDEAELLFGNQDSATVANGFALDPAFAGKFRQRATNPDGTVGTTRLFPDFRPGIPVSDIDGIRASVNNTVGARGIAATATNLLGILGDFTGVYWGVQRRVGLETILYGDPDGQGDLKRKNQIAIRAEVVYGWVIRDLNEYFKFTAPVGP